MAYLAKIAVELGQAVARRAASGSAPGPPTLRVLARGDGWSVDDLICTCGPHDRPFEERHGQFSIALVLAGTFQYRAAAGSDRKGQLMMPGSLLLGNPGQAFECGHEHGAGDRCLSFHFSQDYFERIAADAGAGRSRRRFQVLRLPAKGEMSELAARASAGLARTSNVQNAGPSAAAAWEEIALKLAASTLRLANGEVRFASGPPSSATARMTRALRMIEKSQGSAQDSELTLQHLAQAAGLSPYHFLRTFEQVTGVTPHQYVRRLRLRHAATQLLADSSKILDIVMRCGFGDLSNFNRAFRTEFGVSPRQFRGRGRHSDIVFPEKCA
ncbi:MAG TPA: AraC family transcriptional regulator [Terracidiphilus sp.]|nr:AraC family transcriptional regulator [Terracidiphilus sp.]